MRRSNIVSGENKDEMDEKDNNGLCVDADKTGTDSKNNENKIKKTIFH